MPADWVVLAFATLVGLLVGSFSNVVVYRLPKMLEVQWRAQCQQWLHPELDAPTEPRFNLLVPRSRCPHCGHQIAWYENIPLVSYVALAAKCAHCHAPISVRYPAIELLTAALFAYCAARWGLRAPTVVWSLCCAALICLACIDWDTTLLPDDITLPLLWLGLIASTTGWNPLVRWDEALWGAVAGYGSLWLVYWAFKLLTNKEGMGHGDFKLLAALGAWLGWQALIPLVVLASVAGAIIGLTLQRMGRLREGGYIPFGPFLVVAGLLVFVTGPQRMLAWIRL